jgi:hypothetical protein
MPSGITHDATYVSLIRNVRTPHPGVLLNKLAVAQAGGYRTEDFGVEDLSLWLRIARNSPLMSVPENLMSYRISASSVTGKRREAIKVAKVSVLKEFPIEKSVVDSQIRGFKLTENEYLKHDLSSERSLMLILDLWECSEFYNLNYKREISKIARELLSKDSKRFLNSFIGLSGGSIKRKFIRKFFRHSGI